MVLILYYILLVTLPKIITPDFFLKTTSTSQLNLHETRKMLMYSCMGTYQHNVTSKKDKVHVLMQRSRSRPRPVSMSGHSLLEVINNTRELIVP